LSQRVEAALAEMQSYLHGEIAPPDAADAVATLMAQPPEMLMQQLAGWVAEDMRRTSTPLCDHLLEALKKIYVTGELGLLDREAVANYLDRLMTIALRICPAEDRQKLREDISKMRLSGLAALHATIPVARMPTFTNVPIPVAVSAAEREDPAVAKRFNLILDRLHRPGEDGKPQAAPADAGTFAQLVTMAATQSESAQQFNDYLKVIQPLAGAKEGNVFVILGGAMPSWDLSTLAPGTGAPMPAEVGAMEKIIDLAEDSTVAMNRFRELVTAAVQKFNDGALGATLWMLSVAEDTIKERKLHLLTVDRMRGEAAEAISSVQLRKYTENRSRHAALKIALEFFPTLRLDTLLSELRGEAKADRRRLLLGFIEAYGQAGREAALAALAGELDRHDADTYYLRNLIYILHRVTRESNETLPQELAALADASAPGQNIYVVKEAATALGQLRKDGAVELLTGRLVEFEALLLQGDTSNPPAEVQKLLDRITSSLARIGTSAAMLAVVRHGMTASSLLGDTRARLSPLGQHDLSFDEATVNVLAAALRDELPGVFGRLRPKRQDGTVRLIEALSSTRAEATESLLRKIATEFAEQDIGRAAATAVEKWSPPKAAPSSEPAATLAGELEFFGLPSILQSLAEMSATGMLTLSNRQRQAVSKLIVLGGKFLNARTGSIRGADALYEALERPIAGSFAFVPQPPEKMKTDLEPLAIMPLLFEGVRRHDELQRLIAVAPDSMCLRKGETKPVRHPEEEDAALVRDVWIKASSGTPVADCERELAIDAYRSRRLIAHWLEQGALVAK
jgi:hypothetical protein